MARLLTLSEQKEVVVLEGWTLEETIKYSVPQELQAYTVVFMNGQMINDHSVTITPSDSILLAVVPQGGGGGGGKGALGIILTVAVIVASIYTAGAVGAAYGATWGAVAGAGVSLVGTMAISALIPPPSINTGDVGTYGNVTSEPTYSISGQSNQARKYGAVTKVYGRHKVFPTLAANPLIENLGSDSKISALYDFGLGEVDVTDLKIGDSNASIFNPELTWHKNNLVTQTNYLTRQVGYDQFNYVLKQNQPLIIKTKPNTVHFDIDISFFKGLFTVNPQNGLPVPLSSDFTIYYRVEQPGAGGWVEVLPSSIYGANSYRPRISEYGVPVQPDFIRITEALQKPFVAVVSVDTPFAGTFEIKIEKKGINHTNSSYINDSAVTLIKSYQNGTVVKLDRPHTMLEMRLLASEKISGTVQNLSGIATSVLRTTTDGAIFTRVATRNPAWIAIDILTGSATPKPLADTVIDWPSWIKFAQFCDTKGYHSDFVVDYATTVQELLNSVLSGARASLMVTSSGKYGVLIDEQKSIPRQLITPANSWGFTGSRSFADYPHAFKVGFINPDLNWQRDERIVYNDGYNETNATIFEDLNTFGITDKDQAWKYGRYMMAQGIHRSEMFSVKMDVEHLVVQRGDLVHVANDVVRVGGMPCRVVSITGSRVLVDTSLSTTVNGYSVRLSDGTSRTGAITASRDGSEFTLDNVTGIETGDLMIVGIMDRIVQPYLVQAITPEADLVAEISMVRYVPEVYTADTGAIPPWTPGFGDDLINVSDLKIINLTAKQEIVHIDRQPFNKVTLNWNVEGYNAGKSDIYYSIDGGKQILLGSTESITEQMLIDLLKQPQFINKPVEFEVIPVSKTGIQGTASKVTITPLPDQVAPLAVEGFSVNVQDMLVELFWNPPQDKDIAYYEIRYAPDPIAGAWNASQRIAILPYDVTKTSTGARTGKYFIQATDTTGNRSPIVFQRTSIETLPHVNLVQSVNDQPRGWDGLLSGMIKNPGGSIELGGGFGAINPLGYYTFKDVAKFDDVYEVRVSNKTIAYGVHKDDIVAKWTPVSGAIPLARSTASSWNASLQARTTDGTTVMADWVPAMEVARPMEMSNVTWGAWRNITVTDLTGRQVQFRLKAESFDPNVKVKLLDGLVEIDANDWVWRKDNINVTAAGIQVLYDPPFMSKPITAITIDGSSNVAKYEQTLANRHGFNLKLLDASGTPVAGKVDVAALGQGKQRLKSI